MESTLPEFGANSGDTKLVNRIVPAAGDVMANASIGSEIGFPVYAGETYQLTGDTKGLKDGMKAELHGKVEKDQMGIGMVGAHFAVKSHKAL